MVARVCVKLSLVLLVALSTASPSHNLSGADESVNFVSDYLLPLMRQTTRSLEQNPIFHSHAMGLDPVGDVARWLRKDGRIRSYQHLPLNTSWQDLDDSTREKFKALVNEANKAVRFGAKSPLSEIWKQARANPDLDVLCCGGFCRFTFRFYSGKESSWLMLNSYEQGKSCVFSWGFTTPLWGKLPLDDRRKYMLRHLKDSGCRGELESLASGDPKAEKELRDSYRQILRAVDPVGTYARSEKERCDV